MSVAAVTRSGGRLFADPRRLRGGGRLPDSPFFVITRYVKVGSGLGLFPPDNLVQNLVRYV
jgi:hypothetical protein